MIVAVLCVAVLGLMLFGLGNLVSKRRMDSKQISGTDADPAGALNKALRAHGNTAEYAPFLAVLFLYLGATNPAVWVIWTIAATTVCRVLIVVGLLLPHSMDKPNPMRFIGGLGTYLGGFALSSATALTVL
jgi:uncharacterized membrane protein YecN with MAPEG domain